MNIYKEAWAFLREIECHSAAIMLLIDKYIDKDDPPQRIIFIANFSCRFEMDASGKKIESMPETYDLWVYMKCGDTVVSKYDFEMDVIRFVIAKIDLKKFPQFNAAKYD